MNSVYLSLINLCVQSLSCSLSVSIVIWFPLRNMSGISMSVHTQCELAWYCCQAVRTPHIYSDKHTSAHEEIKLSPPNLSTKARFARQ